MPTENTSLTVEWNKNQGVVLFADLISFFPVMAKMSSKDLGPLINNLYGLWGSEVRKQRGEVIAYIGDSILAVFRKDGCSGMDPEWCATLTAFHLVKGTKKIRPEVDLNVSIHSGEFIEGAWEEQGRKMVTILGNTINHAAVMVGVKSKGIFATRPIVDVLGPRVKHEKYSFRFPGTSEDETIYHLLSLSL